MTSSSQLLLGSCPDSWGVWFADDPRQTPWDRFLDELAEVGYEWLELGPYGYLPTDPAQLSDELARRGLRVSGGTVVGHSGLHRADDWPDVLAGTREVAELTAGVGGKHVVLVLVPGFRDDTTGAYTEPAELDVGGRKILTRSADELGKVIGEEYGVALQVHHHADAYIQTQQEIERFLADTDPQHVSLCLDTGHVAYGGGDAAELIRRYPDRVGYVHIKQMDAAVVERARQEDLPFGQAVALGASCEPPGGLPDIAEVAAALRELGEERFVVVEQDMYPVAFDVPKPIAERTRRYLRSRGIGT